MPCCTAMEHAISEQYVEELHSYTDDKLRVSLGIGIPKAGEPIFKFNLCPWCGKKQITSGK